MGNTERPTVDALETITAAQRRTAARQTRHGHWRGGRRSPTYNSWRAMHERCRRPQHPFYAAYGGRGIVVCERWASFLAFLEDMGERPAGLTLDREDPDGNYEPGNCRWSDAKTQRWNRRDMRAVPAPLVALTNAADLGPEWPF